MSEWKTIETAPKDGTYILLFDSEQVTGCWDGSNWRLTQIGSYAEDSYVDGNPTHWKAMDPGPNGEVMEPYEIYVYDPNAAPSLVLTSVITKKALDILRKSNAWLTEQAKTNPSSIKIRLPSDYTPRKPDGETL